MWHLKTKRGIFWVLPVSDQAAAYRLGIDDEALALYPEAEQAAQAVSEQATGFLDWDQESHPRVPQHIADWMVGIPSDWKNPGPKY